MASFFSWQVILLGSVTIVGIVLLSSFGATCLEAGARPCINLVFNPEIYVDRKSSNAHHPKKCNGDNDDKIFDHFISWLSVFALTRPYVCPSVLNFYQIVTVHFAVILCKSLNTNQKLFLSTVSLHRGNKTPMEEICPKTPRPPVSVNKVIYI